MKMRCTGSVYVVGRGIVTENEIVELDADDLKDPRLAAHFRMEKDVESGSSDGGTNTEQELPGMFDGMEIPDGLDADAGNQKRRTRR